ASNHTGGIAALRHFTGHMVATMCAAAFVFCILVTARALVGMLGERRDAITSFVQFILVSAVLCYLVVAPAAITVTPGRRGTVRTSMMEIPRWSPTNWFLGLYETIRGSSGSDLWPHAQIAVAATLASVVLAVLATVIGYRRQLQLALAPSASAAANSAAPLRRAPARPVVGRARAAPPAPALTIHPPVPKPPPPGPRSGH